MDNQSHHPSAVKKNSLDDIINNLTSEIQSYDRGYVVLGNTSQSTDIMWQPMNNYGSPQSQHNIYNPEPVNVTNNNPYILNTNQYTPFMQPQSSVPTGYVNYDHQVYPQHHHPHHHHHHPQQQQQQQHQHRPQQSSQQQQHQQQQQQQQQMNYTYYQQSQYTSPHPMSYQSPSYGLFDGPCNDAIIENLVQSWSQSQSNGGVFRPFGNQAFQTSREMIPDRDINIHNQNTMSNHKNIVAPVKKVRMVAEVRPMRPSYSDIAKSPSVGPVKKTAASTQVETLLDIKTTSKVKTTVKKKKNSTKLGKGESGLKRQNSSASSEERTTPTVEYKEDKKSEITFNSNEKVWTSSEDLNGSEYYEADENAYSNILAPKSKENIKKDATKVKSKNILLSKNLGKIST